MKRRLLFFLLWLVLLDRAVPPLLERAERGHYEDDTVFRFENSDLFALGPFVDYLHDHPRREHRRVVFFGNSMLFGYFLSPAQAIPAQYQRFDPAARVYNAAINGQEIGTGYLVAKDIAADVDLLYVQLIGEKANPMLPSLIPVGDDDLRRFQLTPPNRTERQLQAGLGRVWNLYRYNYRMQAALFGTSTRVHLYMYKRDLAHLFRVPLLRPESVPEGAAAGVSIRAPRQAGPLPARTEGQRIANDLAQLARAHGKRVVLIAFEWGSAPSDADADAAAFNAAFAPNAEIVIVHIPKEVTLDGEHVNPAASARIAELLAQHEREVRR